MYLQSPYCSHTLLFIKAKIAVLCFYPTLEHININTADNKHLEPAKGSSMITDHSPTRPKLSGHKSIKTNTMGPYAHCSIAWSGQGFINNL
jgi:hypothetical protein